MIAGDLLSVIWLWWNAERPGQTEHQQDRTAHGVSKCSDNQLLHCLHIDLIQSEELRVSNSPVHLSKVSVSSRVRHLQIITLTHHTCCQSKRLRPSSFSAHLITEPQVIQVHWTLTSWRPPELLNLNICIKHLLDFYCSQNCCREVSALPETIGWRRRHFYLFFIVLLLHWKKLVCFKKLKNKTSWCCERMV